MKCYLVEDEENLNLLLTFALNNESYEVKSFFGFKDAFKAINEQVDAWIIDINLPDGSGLELLKSIKSLKPNQIVLIISARDSEVDKLIGLEIGSDDYITKPFLPRELIIRLERLLSSTKNVKTISKFGPIEIDYDKRLIYDKGIQIELTSKEFDVISIFSINPNKAFSREEILKRAWGDDYFGSDRVVEDLLRRIRKKSKDLPIETLYGFGYRWCGYEE